MAPDIRFPHLGIEIASLGKGITIGGFTIAFYGMIIAFGMVMGYLMTAFQAKRTGQEPDLYLDLALWDIVFAVIGARIYYVIFTWDYYKDNLLQIFNTRGGGLAIYGGVIAGVITTIIFGKVRKQNFFQLLDTACIGLITGQIIGRWGNFCNREAFGGYTNGLFAMQLKQSDVAASNLTHSVLKHAVEIDGTRYIQVHPTFLYESLWNIGVLIILLLFTKHRKYNGQIFLIYLLGYGLGRAWIEGLRTDQLIFFGTGVAVSQVLSGGLVVASAAILIYRFVKDRQKVKSVQ
ncbi:prolipoprotein diacylglyceryl transferase [Roseburia sp. CAG:380]|jgi:phosphatidylglycerol:prolipoprotein diacylglycerol transferase|uniref:prolipoprotein diacylglyceryl transferase n=1 Tax=Roseburia sp. AM59-24XD TaxID=2293138 RepID=UPI00033D8C43|nr:prolipoprotein diacylglyceryl transferase [Roseburia sp. AM59-24XD]CDC93635.1 prolipoprotein diacylglyceryl transferase [Roseburia sp. CAG:380]